jgi:Mg2+ and Co2+ transporter CorA
VGPFAKPRSNDEGAVGELKTVAQLNRGAPSTRVSQLSVMVLDKTTIATVSATNRGASGEAAHEQKEVTQVMEDLKSEDPALHKEGCPFLALALLEHIVDINMAVQDALADWQEHTEEAITQFAAKRHSLHLYHMAKMATHLLDYILPLRADIGKKLQGDALLQSENDAATLGAIAEDLDTTELKVKELLASVAGLRSLYESMAADRMNQILFILTLLTVMLAPAQFLTGLYGMNFDTEKGNMPELGSKYGYTAWWVVVVLSSGTLLYFMATKLRAFELYR